MSTGNDHPPIDEEQLNAIVEQLRSEEEASREATLSSLDSFKVWLANHPALAGSPVTENLAQIAPALLTLVQRLLGM